ncbi:hypothetical protein BDA96_10G328300 [Sorghum bicolor]|uniref:Uncharacterized protein n=2 Tax=Sorghum bicolor TaxID=4558 RepID=C5Z986_SORBI|nr:protein APEM9 [Sorghum bicolor]EER88914.1 hypothetical protein SORBI_3010G253800 [Sorghum bicolor]KAG0516028.1 hypothetical protein BDA96_10G328300 [Sorghum bicolor]|eukprot:XP_002437547.1 protein APEM9 [Sorghum bicolor]
MGTSAQESPLWKHIDNAEYYLVSGSFEQAMLAALSVADQIRMASLESTCDEDELLELFESAGMVLVQALKELRRTPEMFVQLKRMFGSVASVPARVFLTGATIQMAAGSVSDLKPNFEEYLANWRYTNDEVFVLDGGHGSASNGFVVTSVMSTGQYFQVAELYTVTFLCIVSQDSETAISWAEKADLTEQSRQDLLKKLHAVRLAANKKLSAVEGVKQTAERNLSTSTNGSTPLPHEDPPKKIAPVCDGLKKVLVKSAQPSQHVANQFDPLFWWFHSIRLKFGKIHIVLPSGKLMFLFSLLFSTMYVLRRKTAGLKRTVFQQASSLRRAFLDALQLAFSVQMNPLAAVQQVPQAPRGSWL